MSITSELKEFARYLGFDHVGITPARPLSEAEAVVVDRIESGFLGGMDWFSVERAGMACNPHSLLPSARSIVSLAMSYLSQASTTPATSTEPRGRVARYAWGLDYHPVIRDKLRELAAFLERLAGRRVESRLFVDSGPIMEREVAFRSGVGWYGKSTNLLTKQFGSWVFLGEVLVDLDLEDDQHLRTSCGQCQECLNSCPTGALTQPYVVDSRRCISFLTIELKGSVPRDLRPLMGDWVFGCDVCQEVCPVNARAKAVNHTPFRSGRSCGAIDVIPPLVPLLGTSEEAFSQRFKTTALRRAKRRGLLRNAAVALGNAGDPGAVPALVRAMEDPEPLVRGHSAWALGRLASKSARRALERALGRESDESVLMEIRNTLDSW